MIHVGVASLFTYTIMQVIILTSENKLLCFHTTGFVSYVNFVIVGKHTGTSNNLPAINVAIMSTDIGNS